jgi:RNA polymerase sigma factor (sigma-70 family)
MDRHQAVRDAIMSAIPHLRAYAFTMSGSRERPDDFVQETLVRALSHIDSFEPGTRMTAWLITILRNAVLSEYRNAAGRWRTWMADAPQPWSLDPARKSGWRFRRCAQR